MTSYKIQNSLNNSVVTEYWDNIEVKRYKYSCLYFGGDIIEFINNHKGQLIGHSVNFDNILVWLKGGMNNET